MKTLAKGGSSPGQLLGKNSGTKGGKLLEGTIPSCRVREGQFKGRRHRGTSNVMNRLRVIAVKFGEIVLWDNRSRPNITVGIKEGPRSGSV